MPRYARNDKPVVFPLLFQGFTKALISNSTLSDYGVYENT